MVAVGLWGAILGRPSLIALPTIFPILMAVGGALGMASVPVPPVELGIAISVVTLGMMVLFTVRAPVLLACVSLRFCLFQAMRTVRVAIAADPVGTAPVRALHGAVTTFLGSQSGRSSFAMELWRCARRAVRSRSVAFGSSTRPSHITAGALPLLLIFAAVGLALTSISSDATWPSVGSLWLTALLFALPPTPETFRDFIFGGFWLSMIVTSATAVLSGRVPQPVTIGAAINAAAWSGAFAAASDMLGALVFALPLSLLL